MSSGCGRARSEKGNAGLKSTRGDRVPVSFFSGLRSRVALEDLGQVLRKRRARHHHIAAGFLRLQFQLALDVRKIPDQVDPLGLLVGLQFPDQAERIDALEIHVDNDERRLSLGLLQHVVLALDESDGQARPFRGFIDFDGEEQVFEHGQDFLGFHLRRGNPNATMQK